MREHQKFNQDQHADYCGDRGQGAHLVLFRGIFSVDAEQHDHKQEQDHDGAAVHDYLDGRKEIGTLVDEKQSYTEDRGDEAESAMDRVPEQHYAGRTHDRQAATDGVDGPGRGAREMGDGERCHRGPGWLGLGWLELGVPG